MTEHLDKYKKYFKHLISWYI